MTPTEPIDREAQINALADAAWQVLDDMAVSGNSCCGLTKAMLRRAYEPFIDEPDAMDGLMTLAEAEAVCRDCGW